MFLLPGECEGCVSGTLKALILSWVQFSALPQESEVSVYKDGPLGVLVQWWVGAPPALCFENMLV